MGAGTSQVEQKEPVEVPPADPKSSLKIQKRGRSGSTPNLKQTDSKPVVTNEKRHSLAASTFPRMSTPNKQQQDLAGETNGLVTLPRKVKKTKVELTNMMITGADGIPRRVYVSVRRNNRVNPKPACAPVADVASAPAASGSGVTSSLRSKLTKSQSLSTDVTSNNKKKDTKLDKASSLDHERSNIRSSTNTSALGGTPSIKDLTCLRYTDESNKEFTVHIIDEVAAEWKKLGTTLDCSAHDLDNIEKNNDSVQDRCRDMLIRWCKGKIGADDEPHDWRRLVEAMRDARCGRISRQLQDILSNEGEWEFLPDKGCTIL